MEERKKNPKKQLAMHLAHIMDEQKRIHEMTEWDREGVREAHREITNEILKNGYDISTILYYAEEYKTLSIKDYYEWVYI
jgi:hypothetical protein